MTDRQRLMRNIQICDLALFEAALFLDTHKTDKDALAYYDKHRTLAMAYKKEYNEKYGPLVLSENDNKDVWQWADGPWPWEYSSDSNG
ncbi:MAG: spore coat protein CotJB [Oscillospiraceae bacterium]